MRKGKKMTGKSWKRIVRILSCIVVFCTTYALILPAITLEAQSYCGQQEHTHSADCYKEILSCTKEEHVHDESCYDEEGNLICTTEEHEHSAECYREVLDCGLEEHEHTLECFSNPDADLEDADDWKVPDKEEGQTVQERIVQVAESQVGVKESTDNYLVENETVKKGISRYGQWDGQPYEDWSGAFARFVLNKADADDKTKDAKKDLSEWMTDLSKEEELKSADKAEPGDVLFVYDDDDEPKAGIVTKAEEQAVTAIIGDWKEEVKKERFSKEDEKLHSVFRPVAEKGTEQEDNVTVPDNQQEQVPDKEEDKTTDNNNDQTNNEEVVWDYSKEVKAEDGATIKVSWNEGTFDTEDVTFQAKVVELSEEERQQLNEKLTENKNYIYRTYDISFAVRNENAELEEVEPKKPVAVMVTFPDNEDAGKKAGIFHFESENGLESVKDSKKSDKEAEFVGKSFSKYTFAFESVTDWKPCYSRKDIQDAIDDGKKHIRLMQNLFGQSEGLYVYGSGDPFVIDLNGYAFEVSGKSAVYVYGQAQLELTNSKDTTTSNASATDSVWESSSKNKIRYQDADGLYKWAEDVGIIAVKNTGEPAIVMTNRDDRGEAKSLRLSGGVGVINQGSGNGISASYPCNIDLDESYVCGSHNTGIAVHKGVNLTLHDGAVVSLNGNSDNAGGGIYADSSKSQASVVKLEDGCLVTGNVANIGGGICIGDNHEFHNGDAHGTNGMETANNPNCSQILMMGGTVGYNTAKVNEGGGIALRFNSGARGVLYGGTIVGNRSEGTTWGGGGVFASQGTFLWMPNGADITNNDSKGLGGGLTGCSTGKIILDEDMNIYGNTASGDVQQRQTDKPKDYDYIVNKSNTYKKGEYWQGPDIFGAERTQVTGASNVGFSGMAGDQLVTVDPGATVRSDDWLVLKNLNKNGSGVTHTLTIKDNWSNTNGAGVLINGWLIAGTSETHYMGDDIGLHANKKVTDLNGSDASTSKTFRFVVRAQDNRNAPVLASGTITGSGEFKFDNRLTVSPEDASGAVTDNMTMTYYLMEESDPNEPTVKYDETVYKIDVSISCVSTHTVTMPVWDPQQEVFESKSVTLKEYQIQSANVSRRKTEGAEFTDIQTVRSFGNVKELNLSTLYSPAAFTNAVIQTKDIAVEKQWNDSLDHSKDTVTVYLKRYTKGQDESSAQIINAVTLNSNVYKGTKYPQGTSTTEWHYTWKDLPASSESTEYIYTVEEECSNPLYTPLPVEKKLEIVQSGEGSQTTKTVDAWAPTTETFVKQTEYLMVNTDKDLSLDISKRASEGGIHKDTNRNLTVLKKEGSVKYYSYNNEPAFKYSNYDGKGGGFVYNDYWLRYDEHHDSGLAIGNGDKFFSSTTNNFCNSNGNVQIEHDGIWYDLVWNNDMFGAMPKLSGGSNVKAYKKTSIQITEGSLPTYTATETFTIKNSRTASYSLVVRKTDSENENKMLKGAEFTLTKPDGSQQTFTTGDDGTFKAGDLDPGTYTLEETKAPEGYKLPELAENRQWTFTLDGSNSEIDVNTLTLTKTISNTLATYELPETGSTGTRFYTAAGTAMLISSAALYEYNKKRRRKGGE